MNDLRVEPVMGDMTVFVKPVSGTSARMDVTGCPGIVDRVCRAPAIDGTISGYVYFSCHCIGLFVITPFADQTPTFDAVDPSSVRLFVGLAVILPPGVRTAGGAGFIVAACHGIVRDEKISLSSGERFSQIRRRCRADKDGFCRVNIMFRRVVRKISIFSGTVERRTFEGIRRIYIAGDGIGERAVLSLEQIRQIIVTVIGIHHQTASRLLQIAGTEDGIGFFPCLVQCGEKQRCEDRDNRDRYQEFYEGEFLKSISCHVIPPSVTRPRFSP